MENSEMILETKKAIFYQNRIVLLRKKGNLTININDIAGIDYRRPSMKNLLKATWLGTAGTAPESLEIWARNEAGKTSLFSLNIEYDDVIKLQEFYKITIN